jgi:hypothetical protein
MRKIEIYQPWHKLDNSMIADIFQKNLSEMTIQPGQIVVNDLKIAGFAMLEVIENRTASTVYRIKQTGLVYQVCQPNGDTYEFADVEDYRQEVPIDELMAEFIVKDIKFTAQTNEHGELWITRHEPPRFKARWVGGLEGLDNIQWIDQPGDDVMKLAQIMRKAGAFINAYMKK